MAANRGGVDDMVELPSISEKDIAENLQVRLKSETIYVSNIKDYFSFSAYLITLLPSKSISVSANEKIRIQTLLKLLLLLFWLAGLLKSSKTINMTEFFSCFLLLYSS